MKTSTKCQHPKKDCFAIGKYGNCTILNDTEFKKNCPFYKTKGEFEKGKKGRNY